MRAWWATGGVCVCVCVQASGASIAGYAGALCVCVHGHAGCTHSVGRVVYVCTKGTSIFSFSKQAGVSGVTKEARFEAY